MLDDTAIFDCLQERTTLTAPKWVHEIPVRGISRKDLFAAVGGKNKIPKTLTQAAQARLMPVLADAIVTCARAELDDPFSFVRGRLKLALQHVDSFDWERIRFRGTCIYVDRTYGKVVDRRPVDWVEDLQNETLWGRSDCAVMKQVLQYMRQGQMRAVDATDWMRKKALRELRVLSAVKKQAGEDGVLGSTIREQDLGAGGSNNVGIENLPSLMQQAEMERNRRNAIRENQLKSGECVSKEELKKVRYVLKAFSGAMPKEPVALSKDQWLRMLEELEIASDTPGNVMDRTINALIIGAPVLNFKDAIGIFDLAFETNCAESNAGMGVAEKLLNEEGAISALRLVATRTRRPLQDVFQDVSFAHLAPLYRQAWVDLSEQGVVRRLRGVFRAFAGPPQNGTAYAIQRQHWCKLCVD
eukprot:GEMP01019720.1.p1 GENE.GEMP01019720.1~~GEMP01019720.1.p1  ORF type:complete len:414 (+),score=92.82 GEMP01019720.1:636-1877(+)